jgi:hypothetical protein
MLMIRQISIRWLLLLTAYVAVLIAFMKDLLYPIGMCGAIAYWMVPVGLAAFVERRVPLVVWCAATYLSTYVLLRESLLFVSFSLKWPKPYWVVMWASGIFSWLADLLAICRGDFPSLNDDRNAAFLGAVIFPLVGLAFSYCSYPVRGKQRDRKP